MIALFLGLLTQLVSPVPGPVEVEQELPSQALGLGRNILVVVLDDVGAVDLEGLPLPNIHSLAAEGVTFEAAFANPTCWVTRRSLHYGQWWIGGTGPSCGGPLSVNEPHKSQLSLPRLLNVRSGLFGKWHLQPDPVTRSPLGAPLAAGYMEFIAGSASNVSNCGGDGYYLWERIDNLTRSTCMIWEPQAVAEEFSAWWVSTKEPRLAVVCPNAAHAPFNEDIPIGLLPRGYPEPASNVANFRAMIVAWDTLLGQMLQEVDLKDTTVILTSDNGTPPGVGGGQTGKGTVYERGIRVPMIVAGAGVVNPGRTSSALVHIVDIFATLNQDKARDGISLLPALQDDLNFEGHDFVLCGVEDPAQDELPGSVCARSHLFKLRRILESPFREQFFVLPNENTNRINDPALAGEVASHRTWLDAHLP